MKIGKEAKKTVEHNYSLEKTIPMIEELYLQLFNKRKILRQENLKKHKSV